MIGLEMQASQDARGRIVETCSPKGVMRSSLVCLKRGSAAIWCAVSSPFASGISLSTIAISNGSPSWAAWWSSMSAEAASAASLAWQPQDAGSVVTTRRLAA